jgi:hypothetical protein
MNILHPHPQINEFILIYKTLTVGVLSLRMLATGSGYEQERKIAIKTSGRYALQRPPSLGMFIVYP